MITKTELSELLHGIAGLNVGEGETFLDQKGNFPRCAYFEIAWEDDMASGDAYYETVTYQISFEARGPRDPALLALKAALNAEGLHPSIYHERVASKDAPAYWHSYMSITCREDLTGGEDDGTGY